MADMLIGEGAEQDYAESLSWYAERSKQAAEGFEAAFVRAIEAIAANPRWYPLCDNRHRFCPLKKYPFQVIYREESGGKLLIVAIGHTRSTAWLLVETLMSRIAERRVAITPICD